MKTKEIGYKIVFTTNKSKEECEKNISKTIERLWDGQYNLKIITEMSKDERINVIDYELTDHPEDSRLINESGK